MKRKRPASPAPRAPAELPVSNSLHALARLYASGEIEKCLPIVRAAMARYACNAFAAVAIIARDARKKRRLSEHTMMVLDAAALRIGFGAPPRRRRRVRSPRRG